MQRSKKTSAQRTNRRVVFQRVLHSIALGYLASLPIVHAIENPTPAPSCGCDAPKAGTSCSRCASQPRKLSIAEEFLRQFDRLGDRIEARANQGHTHCAHKTAGCEVKAGSSNQPAKSCNCPDCSAGHQAATGPTSAPSHTKGQASGTISDAPRDNSPPPMSKESAAPSDSKSAPATQNPSASPLHPNVPPDRQATGKIRDTEADMMPSKPVKAPSDNELSDLTRIPIPPARKLESPPQDIPVTVPNTPSPFEPRFPTGEPKLKSIDETQLQSIDEDPIPKPKMPKNFGKPNSDNTPTSLPLPNSELRRVPDHEPQIPDVLIDPFKDDVSRYDQQANIDGIRLSSGRANHPSNKLRAEQNRSSSNPLRLKETPTLYQDHVAPPAKAVEPIRRRATDEVVRTSPSELSNAQLRNQDTSRTEDPGAVPMVVRKPVPKPKP
jgi:hypothetical protein